MKRGGYSMDLKKQIKFRLDEATLKYLIKISEKKERTLSWLIRDIVSNSLATQTRGSTKN